MKIVLDANLFVSAAIEARGKPAQILDAWRNDQFVLILRDDILEEFERVLYRPRIRKRHQWTDSEINGFLDSLRDLATITKGELDVKAVIDDPGDDKYIACAVEGEADYIVSGDHHLVQLGSYRGIPIVTPAEFLAILAARGE